MVLTANYRFITTPRELIQEAGKKMRDGDKKRKKKTLQLVYKTMLLQTTKVVVQTNECN